MRAFAGIPLPEDLRRAAASLLPARFASPRGWRPAREDGLHVTIKFLGEVEDERLGPLDDAFRAAAAATARLTLRLSGLRVVPSERRPRIVWIDVIETTHGLERLAAAVEAAAAQIGVPAEQRAFAGHVTLARAGREARPGFVRSDVGLDLGSFVADRMVLFSSRLSPGGSVYGTVRVYPFEGPP